MNKLMTLEFVRFERKQEWNTTKKRHDLPAGWMCRLLAIFDNRVPGFM